MSKQQLRDAEDHVLLRGTSSVSDADLLGIALGSVTLAQALVRTFVRWQDLGRSELQAIPRFTPGRVAQVLALGELCRRIRGTPLQRGQALRCSEDVARAYRGRLAHQRQECFLALGLDCRNRVVSEHEVARGSLTSVEVHPREAFGPLIRDGAAATIMVHNHPSGDPSPSDDDRALCERLCEAGALLGIPVLDFVIVGAEGMASFADSGWLPGMSQ